MNRVLALWNFLAILCLAAPAAPAADRDWFVRAEANSGDGSLANPFGDPWQALERCENGDRIHVAAGKYYGKFGTGTWFIPSDGVALIGGYDAEFRSRDPWTNVTQLLWDKTSPNLPKGARVTSQSRDVVVDGFVIDMKDQNGYVDDACTSRSIKPSESALRMDGAATICNCVIFNPGVHGIEARSGSKIVNNVVLNAIQWGIVIQRGSGDLDKVPALVERNTVLLCWDLDKPGAGGEGGSGISLRGPANVTGNLLAKCDNHGIHALARPEMLSITRNQFFSNRFSNVKSNFEGQVAVADDATMDLLEELGLCAFEGNVVLDPKITLDEHPAGLAPALSLEFALSLVKRPAAEAGARCVHLESQCSTVVKTPAMKPYEKSRLLLWYERPESVEGKALELEVAVGPVANVDGLPSQYDVKLHVGYALYDPEGNGKRVTGFLPKGSAAERVCNAASMRYQGRGKPDTVFVVRGIAHAVKNIPKAGFFIESIKLCEPTVLTASARPVGRDWFVMAGSSGGDGSREKPFKDPFQALERCESGDTIHVAEGEYVGKLKIGKWRIDMPFIALLGGYDAKFQERNPWRHPTRLLCPSDYKGQRGGYTLEGADDHTGAIVDGFIFDKRTNNEYMPDGSLKLRGSDQMEHLWLVRPDCIVRNCAFLNGACGAVRIANGQTFENNLLLNHFTQTVLVQRGHSAAPLAFRGNTVLFAWDALPGFGRGRTGHLLRLESDVAAIVESNIFAFADNDAIQLTNRPENVVLADNVFFNNLSSHVQQMTNNAVFNTSTWSQLADLGLRKCANNLILDPRLPVDEKWLESYRARLAPAEGEAPPAVESKAKNPFEDDASESATARPVDKLPQEPAATHNPFETASEEEDAPKSTTAVAAAYDWKSAVNLFPENPECRAGARAKDQAVEFKGVARVEVHHEYVETTWEIARSESEWKRLEGKRVSLRVSIRGLDSVNSLPDLPATDFQSFGVAGVAGTDSGGLPMRCYVKIGTRHERMVRQARGYTTGKPEETHFIKGIARANRQMLVEVVERDQ